MEHRGWERSEREGWEPTALRRVHVPYCKGERLAIARFRACSEERSALLVDEVPDREHRDTKTDMDAEDEEPCVGIGQKRRRENSDSDSEEEGLNAAKRLRGMTQSDIPTRKQRVVFVGNDFKSVLAGVSEHLLSAHSSNLGASVPLNTFLRERAAELKTHLATDINKLTVEDRLKYYDQLVNLGVSAPRGSPSRMAFFQALAGTRFVSRGGAFVLRMKQLVMDARADPHNERAVTQLKLGLKFLLHMNNFCKSDMPRLMQSLEADLLSLINPKTNALGMDIAHFLLKLAKQSFPSVNTARAIDLDWHALDILPLSSEVAEVRQQKDGHIRIPCSSVPEYIQVDNRYSSMSTYMDVYYRLFREDSFGKILHDISCVREGEPIRSGSHFFDMISVVGGVLLPHQPGFTLAIKCGNSKQDKQRKKKMIEGALLALSWDPTRQHWKFATVARVGRENAPYDLLLSFLEPGGKETFSAINTLEFISMQSTAVMLKGETHYRSCGPILRALRDRKSQALPFQSVLLAQSPEIACPTTGLDDATETGLTNIDMDSCHSPTYYPTSPLECTEREPPWVETAPSFLTSACTLDWSCIFKRPVSRVDASVAIDSHQKRLFPERKTDLIQSPKRFSALLQNQYYECILDETQQDAITTALTQEVALVQGPPGTGKTFIGCRLVELLLSLDPPLQGPLLVVTYKNRAVNDFLADIVKTKRILGERIVRVGGMLPRSTPTSGGVYCSRKKKQEVLREEGYIHLSGHGSYTRYRHWQQKVRESTEARLRDSFRRIPRGFTLRTMKLGATKQQQFSLFGTYNCLGIEEQVRLLRQWADHAYTLMRNRVRSRLDFSTSSSTNRRKASKRCEVKGVSPHQQQQKEKQLDSGDESDSDREHMQQHPNEDHGKAFQDEDLIRIKEDSKKGLEFVVVSQHICDQYSTLLSQEFLNNYRIDCCSNLYNLTDEERANWICAVVRKAAQKHAETMRESLEEYTERCQASSDEKCYLLGQMLHHYAKVVGMTVSGAAIYHDLLSEIKPSVVIVEEAAEISEPQLLATLPNSTQQLILIGDQMQLKPHIECYAVEKRGLDRSMFERLIQNGHPKTVLHLQNRMNDEFAELLRILQIYPRLETNPRTTASNILPQCFVDPLFFWTHDYQEESTGFSYTNEKEAQLVSQLALWMVQQQVPVKQITILAMYKGQVRCIRNKLLREGFSKRGTHAADRSKQRVDEERIQVDSVDNFQGNENNIIILSLVRSNPNGSIGYLKVRNRLCVAISRAKSGLYIVGNKEVLKDSRNRDWHIMLNHLESLERIGTHIKLCCCRHLTSPESMSAATFLSTKGAKICTKNCEQRLSCGHPCRSTCHNHEMEEHFIECFTTVQFRHGDCGHLAERPCCEAPPKCMELCEKQRDCGHLCTQRCWETCTEKKCESCESLRREEIAIAQQHAAERRQQELHVLQQKIEEVRSHAKDSQLQQLGTSSEDFKQVERLLKQSVAGTIVDVKFVQKLDPSSSILTNFLECRRKLLKPLEGTELLFLEVNIADENGQRTLIKRVIDEFPRATCIKSNKMYCMGKGLDVVHRGYSFTRLPVQNLTNPYNNREKVALLFDVAAGSVFHQSMKDQISIIDNPGKLKTTYKRDCIHVSDVPSPYQKGSRFDRYICMRDNQALPKYIVYYKSRRSQPSDQLKILPANELVSLTSDSSGSDDMLYRYAESQFHRMISERRFGPGAKPKVSQVDCFYNPDLMQRFEDKASDLELELDGCYRDQILAFHGTQEPTYELILKNGFKIGGEGVDVRSGNYYGTGVYLADSPTTSHSFAEGGKLLMATFLPGRVKTEAEGARENFHCLCCPYHGQADQMLHLVFTVEQVLPMFVIHYEGLQ